MIGMHLEPAPVPRSRRPRLVCTPIAAESAAPVLATVVAGPWRPVVVKGGRP